MATKKRQWRQIRATGEQIRSGIRGRAEESVYVGGALEQLVDDMGGDAPGHGAVVRGLGKAESLGQDLVRGNAEEPAEKLEMLDSQSSPAAQDVADDPMVEAEQASGLALRDAGDGETLLQDFENGGFERAVADVQCVHLLKAVLTDGRAGGGGAEAGGRPGAGRAA